jgi:hypothetical protein
VRAGAAGPAAAAVWRRRAEQSAPVVYGRVYQRLRRRGVAAEIARGLAEAGCRHVLPQGETKWPEPPTFADERHFLAWLVATAETHALDELRRLLPGPPAPDTPGPGGRPRGYSPAVWDCFQRLAPDEQRALLLYYDDGLTDLQIGPLVFGPDQGTPQALAQRAARLRRQALVHLRGLLLAEGLDPARWTLPRLPTTPAPV